MDTASLLPQLAAVVAGGGAGMAEPDRRALLDACAQARDALENPFEKIIRVLFSVQDAAILRVAVDLGLMDVGISKNGPVKVTELAEQTGADAALVRRIMRILKHLGFFSETGADLFCATPVANAYVKGSPLRESVIHFSASLSTVAQFPEYLASTNYKNPDDASHGPWQFAHKSSQDYWKWLETNDPKYQNAFNTVMSIQAGIRGIQWFDYFPVEEKLQVESQDRPVLVDVGGSIGHDLVAFHTKFPKLAGKLVLEDLPQVVKSAKDLPSVVETRAHDFFTPQPVKHAKAYYFRTILHDWPKVQATQILTHLREAMAPDSLLLINEGVVPETGATWFESQLDLHMMAYFAALERTEQQWRELLEGAGFEVVQVWGPEDDGDGMTKVRLIEAKVKA